MARRRYGREEPAGRESEPPADPVEVAREIALRQLTVRARSRAELEKAMAKKGVPQEASDQVLNRFEELNLVDDADFARQWVDTQQRRMKSSRVLAQELRTKGVDQETIEDAMADIDPDADHDAALALARKKARTMGSLEPEVRRRRIAGALARRGFSSDVVRRVLNEVESGGEDADWD